MMPTNTPFCLHNCFTNSALEVKFTVQYHSQVFVFRLPFNFSVTKEQVGVLVLFPFGFIALSYSSFRISFV